MIDRTVISGLFMVLMITGCGQAGHEYQVVIVPSSALMATGFEQTADIYLVRKLAPGEASVQIDQDSIHTELLKEGTYQARWVANNVGPSVLSGSLMLKDENRSYEFQQPYFVLPPHASVSSRYLIRCREN